MNQHRNSRKSNGPPGSNGRPNGHGPAHEERGGASALGCLPRRACAAELRSHAASDDASGIPVATATAFPAEANLQLQASTDREAYAEVAPPAPNETEPRVAGTKNSRGGTDTSKPKIPPGKDPLPDDPAEFVQEIHGKIDLIEVWHGLLRSGDEKVKQRAIEKITAMLYEDGAASSDDTEQILFDLPRPKCD